MSILKPTSIFWLVNFSKSELSEYNKSRLPLAEIYVMEKEMMHQLESEIDRKKQ